jgi:hypothetical protein
MALTDVTDGSRVIQQGMMPYKITLTDTCDVGDLIGYDADSDAWERAVANTKVYAQFVAGEQCRESGNTITVFREAIVTGLSGANAGDPVYLGDTAGEYENTPDSSNYQQVVGVALSATELLVSPNGNIAASFACRRSLGFGGWFRSEIQSGQTAASRAGGIIVECKSIATSTTADYYGIYVMYQAQQNATGSSALIRLSDESSNGKEPDAFIMCSCPNADGPDYFIKFMNASGNGFTGALSGTTCGTVGGYLKLDIEGEAPSAGVRYIQLYTSVS